MKLSCWLETTSHLSGLKSPRNTVLQKGPQKDLNIIKACLKVLNEYRENIPRFVLHYLEEPVPVQFGRMNTLALLSRAEQFNLEVFFA